MPSKAKTFDCVEMKHLAQRALWAEFESRRGQFASYSEFLAATINEDPWQRRLWAKVSGGRKARAPRVVRTK
jgi:hypothetical protein